MRTVAFCEIDPYCRAVLRKHWPDVPCHDDIRTFHAPAGSADVICGGFPCQDISYAGDGAGLAGERSGLWSEYARLIGEVRPRFVIVENVSALLARGLGDVLRDLAAIGYDAEWHCIPASAVGAPHRRDRLWIVGYPHHEGKSVSPLHDEAPWLPQLMADAYGSRPQGRSVDPLDAKQPKEPTGQGCAFLADTPSERQQGPRQSIVRRSPAPNSQGKATVLEPGCLGENWRIEPDVGRVANGIPARVDRLRSLGNAVVPQIPEIIGRAIMSIADGA